MHHESDIGNKMLSFGKKVIHKFSILFLCLLKSKLVNIISSRVNLLLITDWCNNTKLDLVSELIPNYVIALHFTARCSESKLELWVRTKLDQNCRSDSGIKCEYFDSLESDVNHTSICHLLALKWFYPWHFEGLSFVYQSLVCWYFVFLLTFPCSIDYSQPSWISRWQHSTANYRKKLQSSHWVTSLSVYTDRPRLYPVIGSVCGHTCWNLRQRTWHKSTQWTQHIIFDILFNVDKLVYAVLSIHIEYVRPLFHVSVSGSGCVSGCVSGRFRCGRPIPRFSIRQTYLPVFTLL